MLSDVRAVLQRVLSASVTVDGEVVGAIEGPGLLVYLGVTHGDGPARDRLDGPQDLGGPAAPRRAVASDVGGAGAGGQPVHAVRRRPQGPPAHLAAAAPGEVGEPAYDAVCAELERLGAHVERGVFGADMRVESVNDGPVTLILER